MSGGLSPKPSLVDLPIACASLYSSGQGQRASQAGARLGSPLALSKLPAFSQGTPDEDALNGLICSINDAWKLGEDNNQTWHFSLIKRFLKHSPDDEQIA